MYGFTVAWQHVCFRNTSGGGPLLCEWGSGRDLVCVMKPNFRVELALEFERASERVAVSLTPRRVEIFTVTRRELYGVVDRFSFVF